MSCSSRHSGIFEPRGSCRSRAARHGRSLSFAGIASLDVSRDSRRLLFQTSGPQNQAKFMVCDLPNCANGLPSICLRMPESGKTVYDRR